MCELTVSSLQSIGIAVQEKMNKNYTMILISKDSSTFGLFSELSDRTMFAVQPDTTSMLHTSTKHNLKYHIYSKSKKLANPDLI
jgi:hypothetical protein